MQNLCTSRVAQPCETDSPPRYTFREAHEENPMAELVELFPGGFAVEFWNTEFARVLVHPDFVMTDSLLTAISDQGGDVPPAVFWAWNDHGAICVAWHWLELVTDCEYDAVEEVAAA
ncbi:MAG: hypothetical protein F6K00_19750 [Leptolyngbya sp. SIOISBB]|nr:hypothetical protein [Leptolyngbya sp. SIOISBB]